MTFNKFEIGGISLGGLIVGGSILTACFNGCSSVREFEAMDAKILYLAELGEMTNTDGTPKPTIVKFSNGAEYVITTRSALMQQNGQYRTATGELVQNVQPGQQNGNTVNSSQAYSQGYKLEGTISRLKGSASPLRLFFNYGGETDFAREWTAKPVKAPLSGGFAPVPVTVPPALTVTPPPSSVPSP